MIEVHYGVVQINGLWMVISDGLRNGPYNTHEDAEQVARRMAEQAAGLEVQLYLQDETGEIHQESRAGD